MKKSIRMRLAVALSFLCPALVFAQGVTVFAASSLTDAMSEIVKNYAAKGGPGIKTSYAASSALARQIESGAPANVFFSADEDWMDYLDKRSLVEKGTRFSLLGNRLVLVAPAGAPRKIELRKGTDLASLLGPNGRLATGDPASVPVGKYAQQALTYLGAWQALEPRIARADNVRVALAYVERGEAPLGIVYSTDAAIAKGVQVIGEFPPESHPPISYPVALVAKQATPEAREFLKYLQSGDAASVFRKYGFSVK
jgi:molybdate transport system substrate-binding protein